MKNILLNANYRIFAIKLKSIQVDNLFICKGSGLIEAIKTDDIDRKGIEYIKEFDPVKCTFRRVSKDSILNHFSWDTESYLYLQKHYYFNKQERKITMKIAILKTSLSLSAVACGIGFFLASFLLIVPFILSFGVLCYLVDNY